MKSTHRPVSFLGSFAIAGIAAIGTAQAQVDASLVAADTAVQPGKSVIVALRLEHQPHWHTYWINPGVGRATSIKWELPAGWTAGEIDWPTPIAIRSKDGSIIGNGYDGELYLPIVVTAPKNATMGEVPILKARADWLMCSDICVPADARLDLALPVQAATPQPNPQVRAGLTKMPMPRTPKGWTYKAKRRADAVTLEIIGVGTLKDAHFFSAGELIQFDGVQKFRAVKDKLTVTLPVDKYFEGDATELTGLLAYTDAAGAYTGVRIKAPLLSD